MYIFDDVFFSRQVKKVAPQVEHAAKIVLENPDNEVECMYYQRLKECISVCMHNRVTCTSPRKHHEIS